MPSCPDWSGADLVHHLAQVQDFWAQVVAGADGDGAEELARPADDADLPAMFKAASARLLGSLESVDPAGPAWSWHPAGGTVGWVLRRQAHEALIHRVDAELTAGVAVTAATFAVAADGVDEALSVMLDVPAWGTITLDGSSVQLVTDPPPEDADGTPGMPRAWTVDLGGFSGTDPETGQLWEFPVAVLVRDRRYRPDAVRIAAPAWDLDRWLWGRGELDLSGQPEEAVTAVARVREVLAEQTQ